MLECALAYRLKFGMGSIWSRRSHHDFLSEPLISIHFTSPVEDTWVYVNNEGPHTQDLTDSMVLVNMPQQASTEQTNTPTPSQDMMADGQSGQPIEDQSTEKAEGQEKETTEDTQPIGDQKHTGAIKQHVDQTKPVLDDMTVGEVTEMKQKAIQNTMRKYAHQMCERISITCLAVTLYSLEVIDYTVFAKFGNISAGIMQDAHFLVGEVIRAVHKEAKKFGAFCRSISLVHSSTYAEEIWSYYREELERLQKSESGDVAVALKEVPALVPADTTSCGNSGISPRDVISISQRGNEDEYPIPSIQRNGFPLHQACWCLEHDTVCRLVQSGCSVNVMDHEGNVPLHRVLSSSITCREQERLKIMEQLLQCNSDVSSVNKEGNTPLHIACKHGTEECALLLLNAYICDQTSITKQNKNGHTALHLAVLRGHEGIVRVLLSHNSSVAECPDEDGNTPLHVACAYKLSRIVEIIVGFNKNCLQLSNKAKMTALHFACKTGDSKSVDILLKNHADTHCLDENGDTPLHMACRRGVAGTCIVRMLLKKCTEACIDQANKNLETALHIAAYHGAYTTTQKLLKHHAKRLAKDKDGKTPVDVARERNHCDVLKTLEKKGIKGRLPSWSSQTSLSSQSSNSTCSLTSLAARK